MKKMNFSNVLAGTRSTTLTTALFVVLVASALLLFANFLYLSTQTSHDKEYLTHAGELRVLSQRIAKNVSEAAAGSSDGFRLLRESRQDFDTRWSYIRNGNPTTGLPAAPAEMADQVESLDQDWQRLNRHTSVILNSQAPVSALYSLATTLADTIPQLQLEYEEVVDTLLRVGAPADQVAIAQRQSLLAERINASVAKVLAGDENSVLAADMFSRDANLFGRVLKGMREGDRAMQLSRVTDREAVERLDEINQLFAIVAQSVDQILETSPELFGVREASEGTFSVSQSLLDKTSSLAETFEKRADGRFLNTLVGYVLGALILGAIVMLSLVNMRDTRRSLKETAEKNERNQTAILRLLDEIGDLADGDLTTQATVTEDFTGAIADSINFTIDQLRDLVGTINASAVQVSAAAQDTQSTATHLAEASEHQAQEIAGASAAINEMAVSIDQVSANAAESSAVAERSVSIANKGSEVVHNTIAGMDKIREQIQDTSKRIKRLGESSQEIGDIVSLINDIADQTNILALNAAIQASMAGDAGRGFAVVADEVQRLAERSSAATKQIEALVKTIQTDTNEAVISMEQTTTEVVRGATLAQDAGVSLEEIENVSRSLASLIQNISNAARQQASSAGHISNTMNVIQEITSQTSSGTLATAQSIGHLAKLANEMRDSVSGFTLPNQK
ncbi:MAG: type IV pili methyl-accepting chemotaxis transducer N-terminal domain-containing protein [Thiopseudomonas sp.]|nr:type IV pili methyl-accepting chemotaxis transducer N-terminal domain-containing protein [Thiopseudomonas sp.]